MTEKILEYLWYMLGGGRKTHTLERNVLTAELIGISDYDSPFPPSACATSSHHPHPFHHLLTVLSLPHTQHEQNDKKNENMKYTVRPSS